MTFRRRRPPPPAPVDVLVGEPFTVPSGMGRTTAAGATDRIRDTLRELIAVLDDSRARRQPVVTIRRA